jgi:hypothetical protein
MTCPRRANALYEGTYLLGTSIARPLIAKRQIEIAKEVRSALRRGVMQGRVTDVCREDGARGCWPGSFLFTHLLLQKRSSVFLIRVPACTGRCRCCVAWSHGQGQRSGPLRGRVRAAMCARVGRKLEPERGITCSCKHPVHIYSSGIVDSWQRAQLSAFCRSYYSLKPDIRVIAPWREWDLLSRTKLIEYAEKNKIPVPQVRQGES